MTIRPVDLQTIMPKTTEVSKMQHFQKENLEAQKSILTVGFQEQLKQSRQKVNKRNKINEIKIEKEQQKENYYNKDKSKKQSKEQKNQSSFKNTSRYIDIKI